MKRVLLSADSDLRVYLVPDEAADHLEELCMEFCCHWLWESPEAERYRLWMGGIRCLRYTEADFIAYLNRYRFQDAPSLLIETLEGVYDREQLSEEYADLPWFNF